MYMNITDVNSRMETLDIRYASNRRDAINSAGISRDATSSREARNIMDANNS
jgi:hypothetical protein